MSSSSLTPDSGSDLSELSDVDAAELEKKLFANKTKGGLDAWLQGADGASSPPPKRKREPSPPHEYVLADNPDIAFIVMFRARFASAFPRFVPNVGPQDIENSIIGSPPGELAEKLLCAILGLVLNRKKDIGVGHHGRALEEAILANRHQWPSSWGKSPISGDGSFNNMSPEQRLNLLRTLIMWALNTSEAVQSVIKESYKQSRHDDDLNQPLSVQPWGRDSDKRKYWLIEGQDDTHFRLYRESAGVKSTTWWSIAGTIDEIKAFADKLTGEGTQASKRLSDRINAAVPRFEGGEEKRKRREYRMHRKMQFARPEPGFSIYEGRTRGKRMKYTFSDDEDATSDAYSARRSTRNATPAEPAGPTITSSGRQVRSRLGGVYGETLHAGQAEVTGSSPGLEAEGENGDVAPATRTRSGRVSAGRKRKSMEYESDDDSNAASSGNEWRGDEEEDDADDETEDDADMGEDEDIDHNDELGTPKSLVVKLQVGTRGPSTSAPVVNGTAQTHGPPSPKAHEGSAPQAQFDSAKPSPLTGQVTTHALPLKAGPSEISAAIAPTASLSVKPEPVLANGLLSPTKSMPMMHKPAEAFSGSASTANKPPPVSSSIQPSAEQRFGHSPFQPTLVNGTKTDPTSNP